MIEGLARHGHQLHLGAERGDSALGGQQLVERLASSFEHVSFGPVPWREQKTRFLATKVRLALDYLRYLDPKYAETPALRRRASVRTSSGFVWMAEHGLFGSAAVRGMLVRALDAMDRAVPPSPDIERFLDEQAPDAVIVTPLIGLVPSSQIDLLRSARARRLPTAVCVWSWDHLSSKAIIRDIPDRLFVWNEVQRDEAMQMHQIPAGRVTITGAQCFDRWFDCQPTRTRAEFARHVGLPDDRPYLLWVCSALFPGSPSEAEFVMEWAARIRASADPRLRDVAILVRPHPSRRAEWDQVDWHRVPHLALWGDNPVDAAARADYFDSLFYSEAVVGLNTSAFIEAGIVGRPVLAILPEQFHASQEGTLHFHYLIDGGLLTTSRSLDEHVEGLPAILASPPQAILARQLEFVRRFVRPRGLDVSATAIMVREIEQLPALALRPQREAGSAVGALGLNVLRVLERVPFGRRLLLDEREVDAKQRRADIEGREVSWL